MQGARSKAGATTFRSQLNMSISRTLAQRMETHYSNPKSLRAKLRAKRIAPFLEMLQDAYNQRGYVEVIDIGGTENYWNIVSQHYLEQRNVTITIVNLPGSGMPRDHGIFRFAEADGCDLSCFGDNSFHIAHSNSVIEHVGHWRRIVQFAAELERVAEKLFVQTPNYWFPIEPHCMTPFFHWLPRPTQIWLVLHLQLGHWSRAASIDEAVRLIERAYLLNKKMLQEAFKDSCILTERFLGLPKSFVAIKR